MASVRRLYFPTNNPLTNRKPVDCFITKSGIAAGYMYGSAEFYKSSGSRSSLLENQVPEMLFTDPDAPAVQKPQGISATKAIAIAMGQG